MGIDYGMGRTNIDMATGIRYGVISPHSLNPDAVSDIYDQGENQTYQAAVADAKAAIACVLEPVLEDLGVLPYVGKYAPRDEDKAKRATAVAAVVDDVWEGIEQDWNDQYTEEDDCYLYSRDGYVIQTSSLGLYVIKSPFYTLTAYCSPCAPGAGNLDAPDAAGVRTYCLGAEWFEAEQAPYAVFRVDDDTEVLSHG